MTARQREVLVALGRGACSTTEVAMRVDLPAPTSAKVLDALFRRSLVTVTDSGRWMATERGRKLLLTGRILGRES